MKLNQKNIQNSKTPVMINEYGKLPPQAPELEEAVLGALMLEKEAYGIVCDYLNTETFYKPYHQIIYSSIVSLSENQEPVDMMSVTEKLRKEGKLEDAGGAYHIAQLTSKVVSSVHIEYHAKILKQKYIARKVIEIASNSMNLCYDDTSDIDDVIFELSSDVEALQESAIGKYESFQLSEVLRSSLVEMYDRKEKYENGLATGINTGLTDLNKTTGGWQKSDLIIVAGRPAMGKTAVALHFAKSAARSGTPVVIFELEMSHVRLSDRLLMSEADVCPNGYKVGKLTDEDTKKVERAAGVLYNHKITIDSNPNVTMDYIRNRSRILKKQGKCGMVIIDYLQLVEGSGNKNSIREQEVAQMSRKAKLMAKELDIPVILLSQLSRKVEERANKKPILSDLRESGAIEQDADMVVFIHRDEYYNKNSENGKGNLIIAKYRNGSIVEIDFSYNKSMTKIFDVDKWGVLNIIPQNTSSTDEEPF